MMTCVAIGHQEQRRGCCKCRNLCQASQATHAAHATHATKASQADAAACCCCWHHQHRTVHKCWCRAGIAAVCSMLHGQAVKGHIQNAAAVVAVAGIVAAVSKYAAAADAAATVAAADGAAKVVAHAARLCGTVA